MIALLVESAGRSMLVLVAIFALVALLRIRGASVQITAWRIGLAAALLMPALMQLRVVSIPMDVDVSAVLFTVAARADDASSGSWYDVLAAMYSLVAAILLARLATGLVASWRLLRNATRVSDARLSGHSVRVSLAVKVPVTVGSTVLLPMDYLAWGPRKLQAVLAHEAEHALNADFYWHVAALLHRAIFWINPIAWWLPKRMAELAESRADQAAINAVGDPVEYAQVLLDFSKAPTPAMLTVAMARSASVKQRVEQLLSGDLEFQSAPSRSRFVAIASTIAVASVLACASCERQANKGGQIASTPASQPTPSPNQTDGKKDEIEVPPRVGPAGGITKPPYDPAWRRAGYEGTVYVQILVDVDGRVTNAKVQRTSGHEVLDNAVLAEARTNWRLLPGTVNGKPTPMWVTVPIVYKITRDETKPAA